MTTTRAQRQQNREERIQKADAKRLAEKRQLAELHKKESEEKSPASTPLSNKEKRKQKQQKKKQQKSNSAVTTHVESTEEKDTETVSPGIEPVVTVSSAANLSSQALIMERLSPRLQSSASPYAAATAIREAKDAAMKDVEEKARSESDDDDSRLVENHSTYCDGLRPVLIRLEKKLHGCIIIPGKISEAYTHAEVFDLRFQREVNDHTYKFVARNGHTAQDVSISIESKYINMYTLDRLQEIINEIISPDSKKTSEASTDLMGVSYGMYNHEIPRIERALQKEKQKQKHTELKQREAAAKKEQNIKRIASEIRNKDIGNTNVRTLAESFHAIEEEGKGGKHAYGHHSHNSLKHRK